MHGRGVSLRVCLAIVIIMVIAIAVAFWRRPAPVEQPAESTVTSSKPRQSLERPRTPIGLSSSQKPRPAGETLRVISDHFGISFRVTSEPSGRAAVPALNEGLDKVLTKYTDSLGIPLLAQRKPGDKPTDLTLTAAGLIVGPTSPVLEQRLERLARAGAEERPVLVNELEELGDDRLEPLFVQRLLHDSDPMVRAEAGAALHSSSRAESHLALVKALHDSDPWVVDNVRVAIQQVGALLMQPYLRTSLTAANQPVRLEAADLLERIFGLPLPEDFWLAEAERQEKVQ